MKFMRPRNLQARAEGADSPLNVAVEARARSTSETVAAAIRHRQTMLAFQPVMQAHPPHKTAFYEGLIRVLDETGRIIPARDFLPQIKDTDLGRQLDCIALDTGLKALANHPELRLSINMSARSIGYKPWMQVLDRCLKRDEKLGERLMLEICEHSAMTVPELVIDFMDRLQGHGIAFAMDDFGASQIAFRHFRNFFFDAAKIDGQFVRNVADSHDNQSVARALVAVAREFDMLIVANSVERIEDAEFLVSIGVDCLQGYLFGAPTVRPDWAEKDDARKQA